MYLKPQSALSLLYNFNDESSSSSSSCASFNDESISFNDVDDLMNNSSFDVPLSIVSPMGNANIIPTNVVKLVEIATFRAALGIWTRVSSDLPNLVDKYIDWKELLRSRMFENVSQMLLPSCIQLRFHYHLCNIMTNVENWVIYHSWKIFSMRSTPEECISGDYYHKNSIMHISYIIWYPNGAIDYEKTARNLLHSELLSDFEKFRVACTFCFQEEVEKRWPLLPVLVWNNDAFVSLGYDPSIFYWDHFCKGNLNEIPSPPDLTIDEYMLRKRKVADNWPAIEYFFDRLNSHEQVMNAMKLIQEGAYEVDSRAKYQDLILSKLDEIQRITVCETVARQMVANYACNSEYSGDLMEHNAISTWYEVRDLISEEDFTSLLNRLISHCANDNILIEIWASTPDNLKSAILNCERYNFVNLVLRQAVSTDRFGLMFAILRDRIKLGTKREKNVANEIEYYKSLWTVCEKFMQINDSESLSRLLSLDIIPNSEKCFKHESMLLFLKNVFFKNQL